MAQPKSDVRRLQRDVEELEIELKAMRYKREVTTLTIKQLRALVKEREKEIVEREKVRTQLVLENEARDSQIGGLKRHIEHQKRLTKALGNILGLPENPPKGQIIGFGAAKGVLIVSLGEKDIKLHHRLLVTRGEERIAHLSVTWIFEDLCVTRVDAVSPGQEVRIGDGVLRKDGEDAVRERGPAGGVEDAGRPPKDIEEF